VEDRLSAYRQREELLHEYKDVAAKSCYSLIAIVGALLLLRPLMIGQILSRADACSSAGLLDESRRLCDKALLIDGESSDAWYQLAQVHMARGNREIAYGMYQKAAQADPLHRRAHFELGALHVEDGRYKLAIPYFEQVRRLGPDRALGVQTTGASYHRTALEMLVLCHEKEGDPRQLELVLKELRVFYPSHGAAGQAGRLTPNPGGA
jgi:tetratricopeptide (TPR) repeat protein